MGYFRTYNMIAMVALLAVMLSAVAAWSTIEDEVSGRVEISPCVAFDRWSPREAERHQFIYCIAARIGLKDFAVEDIQIVNEWHGKYGFSLAIKHAKGRKYCRQSSDVWYLDRQSLKVIGFESEQILCETLLVS